MTRIWGDWLGRLGKRMAQCALWLAIALAAAPAPAAAQGARVTPEYVDRVLRSAPQVRRSVAALRTHYPRDYQAMIERIVTLLRTTTDPATARQDGFTYMRAFMAAKADALFAAPEADLVALAAAYRDFAESLAASDVRLCAQWSLTGFDQDSRPSAASFAHLDAINAAQIVAIHNSETGGAVNRAPIGPTEMEALQARMQAIDPAAAALIAGGGLANATAEEQCRVGRTLYRAVAELPAPQAAGFTAFLLRQYFRAPPTPVPVR